MQKNRFTRTSDLFFSYLCVADKSKPHETLLTYLNMNKKTYEAPCSRTMTLNCEGNLLTGSVDTLITLDAATYGMTGEDLIAPNDLDINW